MADEHTRANAGTATSHILRPLLAPTTQIVMIAVETLTHGACVGFFGRSVSVHFPTSSDCHDPFILSEFCFDLRKLR